jgi:hypothetical protein
MRSMLWHLRTALAVSLIMTGVSFACSTTYHGTITDAETKQPISGAVVVVQWAKRFPLGDTPTHYHRLEETATDANGHFEISACPGINMNPFLWIDTHHVFAYAPGYFPWPDYYKGGHAAAAEHVSKQMTGQSAALAIALRPIETPNRAKAEAHLPLFLEHDAPRSRIPLLIRAVNGERRRFNLPLYPEPR